MDIENRVARLERRIALLGWIFGLALLVTLAGTASLLVTRTKPTMREPLPPFATEIFKWNKDWVVSIEENGKYLCTWHGRIWEIAAEDRAKVRRWQPTETLVATGRPSDEWTSFHEEEDGLSYYYHSSVINLEARQVVSGGIYSAPEPPPEPAMMPEPPMPEALESP